ncbi:phage tail assembly chaperone G [Fictibacillus aquaticus]|uniref:Phage protein n=1 Tax=Fictibacillus aquaticus TaxID=2021314 RepID=A0A235F9M5_9BACL|nr:hypothetical protein [Fictibacillus aquaticus]OYD57869.1 hypothetical protein CGZ90_08175 [Fictibacillus aquaticus]
MNSLTLTLVIDGEEKKFTSPAFIPGKMFRQASEIALEFEKGSEEPDLDKHIDFVCRVFENKFSHEQFEDGTDSRNLMKTIYGVVHFVVGNVAQASKLLNDGKEEDGGQGN